MENYMKYKIMGSVKRIRMKPGCIPSRFGSQCNKKRNLSPTPDQLQHVNKKTLLMPILEDNKQVCPNETSISQFQQELLNKEDLMPSCSSSLEKFHDKAMQVVQYNTQFWDPAEQVQRSHEHVSCYTHKVVQGCVSKHYRSTDAQYSLDIEDNVSLPIQPIAYQSIAASLNKPCEERDNKLTISGQSLFTEEQCDSDASYTLSQEGSDTDSSPSQPSSQTTVDSSQEKYIKDHKSNLQCTLSKIIKNPKLYIGIPAKLYFIVDLISKHTKLSEKYILLCLMKIKSNRTFSQLANDFDISLSQAREIFCNKISSFFSVLLPFMKTFTICTIKNNLPIKFHYKYHKINCIIYCLEIVIQKPKNAIHQALTWSKYKKANTYKYLISCTPDGLVSFVSRGYGGRISDINLLEHSKFFDSLQPNSYILAYRGFKHTEMYLKQRGFTLLRLPIIANASKQTEEIARLRIHVERVITRIQEFKILQPHSVVSLNFLHVLNSCVITACALINLQDSLIK
ncbi:unnamed protein product [Acanthoscelides obtectus]|uniref:DDE Tnp4 domain-containing protein n=1 Tax=Acanthoscelides obtectus TaxID=200917 RepID=A0A9P0LHJ3_ACAOB|nr:unnamed protein product [Acanthoscelides obtectus]CAK1673347.1 hypothetical protein AOBTE_LOCUS29305 [Acanthoscelides obtectus]